MTRGAPSTSEENFRGAKLTGGGGSRALFSTLLQGAKMNDSLGPPDVRPPGYAPADIFDLKYTDDNMYVVESPEILIRNLLSIQKLQNLLKNIFFDPKNTFSHPNLRTFNMYALASFGFGFSRSKIPRNDKKILCIRQNHVLIGGILLD